MNVGVPMAGQDKDLLAYYLQGSASNVVPFPSGFRMILGNAHATSVAENPDLASGHIYWKCGPGSASHLNRPPTSCGSNHFLVTVFQFPQFWSGQQHAGNEIDEMSYQQDSSHPIALPKLVLYFRNSQAAGNFGSVTLSSGAYYTEHADYFDAWNPANIASLVDSCINSSRDCGVDPNP
jgi:hypothetical protein